MFSSSVGLTLWVMICGQRAQAGRPSCTNQRQSWRMRHGGSDSETAGISCTNFVARPFAVSRNRVATRGGSLPQHGKT